jgi:hypothetical protein
VSRAEGVRCDRSGAQGIRTLRQLDVSQCLGLTDAMGERLYLSRSAMESLDISYTAVSSDVVGFLAAVRAASLPSHISCCRVL